MFFILFMGLIIAWFTFISNISGIVLSLIGLIFLTIYKCNDLPELFNNTEKGYDQIRRDKNDKNGCDRGLFIGLLVVLMTVCIGLSIIGYRAIMGIKTRDHLRVKPIMILYAVITILSLFSILTLSLPGILIVSIQTAILGYIYVVIYSVYDLLRRQYESAFGNQNQEAIKALSEV